MLSNLPLSFSMVSGIMSCLLFLMGMYLEKDKKKSKMILLWAVTFLTVSFTGLEWAFWLEGYNMFQLIFRFTFPLIVYFAVWLGFVIWLFESRAERRIWIILIIVLTIIVIISVNCMNCIRF